MPTSPTSGRDWNPDLRRLCCCVGLLGLAALAVAQADAPLTMADAVGLALEQHPSVAAARHRVQAARHRARAASAFPNAELTFTPFWGSANVGGSDEELIVHQPLDVRGERRLQTRVAGAQLSTAESEADVAAQDLALEVRTAYIELLLARDMVSLNETLVQTATQFRDAAQTRFDAGDAPRIEIDRAALELARGEQELARARSDARVGEAELNAWLGRDPSSPLVLAEALAFQPVDVDAADAGGRALAQRSELRAAEAELAARKAEVRLAGAARLPDVAVEYRRNELSSSGQGAALLTATIPLGDFGSIRHELSATRADVEEQESVCEDTRRKVVLGVEVALARLKEARELASRYETDIVPRTESVTRTIELGFAAGASTIMDVLDAQRTLRSVQTEQREAVAEYMKATAALARATGEPVGPAPGQDPKPAAGSGPR